MLIPASDSTIKNADCIIFDCDGVLVDVSDSYYATIKETVSHVVRGCLSSEVPKLDVLKIDYDDDDDICSPHIIEKFKAAGMFNDEVDLSCAIVLCVVAAFATHTFLGKSPKAAYNKLIDDVTRNITATTTDSKYDNNGISFVISYLQNLPRARDAISAITSYMEHPSSDRTGRLCKIFDQIFFGPHMYKRVRQKSTLDSELSESATGMIKNDHILITKDTLCALSDWFGRKPKRSPRISMVTGRGFESVRYTLEPHLKWFDIKNSAFLEDESRDYAKPNPRRLDDCIRGMNSDVAIYVGDSVEDAIMAKDAASDVIFCGIVGASYDPKMRLDALQRAAGMYNTIITCDSVCDIPKALKIDV